MIRRVVPGVARGTVRVPGSKSYTHRALAVGFVSRGPVTIRHPLDSDDTRATARALRRLGATLTMRPGVWHLRPPSRRSGRAITVDCRESGTTLRLVTALAALGDRPVRFVGRGRLPDRPMAALLRPLADLGAIVRSESADHVLPFTIRGPIGPGRVTLSSGKSSQPVSGLLVALSGLEGTSRIDLRGPVVSRPYIDATVAWMRAQGIPVRAGRNSFVVRGPPPAGRRSVVVPGDASSAAYAWAAAAASNGSVTVSNMEPAWPQADLRILSILASMGVEIRRRGSVVRASGRATRGVRADLVDSPDLFPLVGALAATVPGKTSRLAGAPQLRHKESDRWTETAVLARALGAEVVATPRELRITGGERVPPLSLTALTDHRMVMSAAVGSLAGRAPSRIGAAEAVRKSYPEFWAMLGALTEPGRGRT